jgi:hypothetical protein
LSKAKRGRRYSELEEAALVQSQKRQVVFGARGDSSCPKPKEAGVIRSWPNLRWMDGWSDEGCRKAGSKKLEEQGQGQGWRQLLESAKTLHGL